ncbi:hypothetical protein GSI_05543 [Ganoderma sinense ZZ0214-1]|uniref:Uncharacterized protein n=1 Tax=Ganoderma sinense ZZ0214-1 TaxID=1077348 RepID=A0A2G8SFE0_9APHY|nr:hypothetical protein GSI_05543 [Ganoderma sinense ZZ0214-1]
MIDVLILHSFSKGGLVEDSEMKLYGSSTVVGSTIIYPGRIASPRSMGQDPEASGSTETMESNDEHFRPGDQGIRRRWKLCAPALVRVVATVTLVVCKLRH